MDAGLATPATAHASGFWRRLLAFAIDGLVLGVAGAIAGFLLFDALAGLGVYGRLIGFAVALSYFGLFNSRLGGGQTPGKRLLAIRTTRLDGSLLSVPRSLARYAVIGVPFFLNNAPLPMEVVLSPMAYVLSLVVFGGLLSIAYLLVFNRKTRRSLHDYAVGSWVVRADARQPPAALPAFWRGHAVVVGVLMLAALMAPLAAQRVSQEMPVFADLLPAVDAINAEPGVQFANVKSGFHSGTAGRLTFTAAEVTLAHSGVDDEAFARRLAERLLEVSPRLGDRDLVAVTLRYGFDLGIASGWRTQQFRFPPAQLAQ